MHRFRFSVVGFGVKYKIEELTKTLYSKTADYGQSFNRHGIVGLVPRLWDKIARYTMLSAKGYDIQHESKEDSIRDLLGYCLITWSLAIEAKRTSMSEVANG
jgi:hypothetical protein